MNILNRANSGEKIASIICGAPTKLDGSLVEGLVVAADSGLDRALEAGVKPDIAAGDFDSTKIALPEGIEYVRVPPEKDVTDAWLAAEIAIERGCGELRIFCALGGRIDHTMANLQMLYSLKLRGVKAEIIGEKERVFFLREETARIERTEGYLSVFAFGGNALVSERGVKYEVERAELRESFPLGVSNEICGECAEIAVHRGTVMIMMVRE